MAKVWGSENLEPWFDSHGEKIGEVWFPAGDLLIKFLFTTEKLSVQVHPDDAYAREHEDSRGKTEMWHILRADPGGDVALGFREQIEPQRLDELCRTGDVMEHLRWFAAHAGDTFYTPAGTVHAIGAGLALCEIQQNSDVTYRMFDYGRPRELHLARALEVADCGCHPGASPPGEITGGRAELVRCEHFVTERVEVVAGDRLVVDGDRYLVVLEGSGSVGDQVFRPGSVWELGTGEVTVKAKAPVTLLLTGTP